MCTRITNPHCFHTTHASKLLVENLSEMIEEHWQAVEGFAVSRISAELLRRLPLENLFSLIKGEIFGQANNSQFCGWLSEEILITGKSSGVCPLLSFQSCLLSVLQTVWWYCTFLFVWLHSWKSAWICPTVFIAVWMMLVLVRLHVWNTMLNCCPACIITKYREWVGKTALKKPPIINEWLLTSQNIHNIDIQSRKLNECNQDSDYFSQEVCVRKRGQTFVLLGILRPIFCCEKCLVEMWSHCVLGYV